MDDMNKQFYEFVLFIFSSENVASWSALETGENRLFLINF